MPDTTTAPTINESISMMKRGMFDIPSCTQILATIVVRLDATSPLNRRAHDNSDKADA